MTSQTFNFSGSGQETSGALTIPAGGLLRIRIASAANYPQLSLSITQNGVTSITPIKGAAAGAMEVPLVASGDTITLNYEGQNAGDAIAGILEIFISAVFAALTAGAGSGTPGTLDFSVAGNPLSGQV